MDLGIKRLKNSYGRRAIKNLDMKMSGKTRVKMDRADLHRITREAYNELREGFIPEWPDWDDLSMPEQAKHRVFAQAIIRSVGKECSRLSSELENKQGLDSLTASRIKYLEERAATHKAEIQHLGELGRKALISSERLRNDYSRIHTALTHLADKVVNGIPIDIKELPDRLSRYGITLFDKQGNSL
jgi:hypothetical protein